MTIDYSAVDAAILASLENGPVTFSALAAREAVTKAAKAVAQPSMWGGTTDAWRIVDRRLQSLRKAGKAAPAPGRKGWIKTA